MIENWKNTEHLGDCLEVMKLIPNKSVDAIFSDLPYKKTEFGWDTIIPFIPLWIQYERIIKDNGVIGLFGMQPFTSSLILSNIELFKYTLVWDKDVSGSFSTAKLKPMITHEDICIFSKGTIANGSNKNMIYIPQMTSAKKENIRPVNKGSKRSSAVFAERKNGKLAKSAKDYNPKKRYPKSILKYSKYMAECNQTKRIHPTQKPVALIEYLIKTYSRENDIILDSTAGSFTLAEACINTNRNYIVIEKDPDEFKKGSNRIKEHKQKLAGMLQF